MKIDWVISRDNKSSHYIVDSTRDRFGESPLYRDKMSTLLNFIGISEGAIRLMKEKDLHRIVRLIKKDCNYLGANNRRKRNIREERKKAKK